MNNSKPMLLSLSLAGAIGFYLYNKLIQTGHVATLSPTQETCEEKTRRELATRPIVVEEQPEPQPQLDVFEDVVETEAPVVAEIETPVLDEFDALMNEPVVTEEVTAPVEEEVPEVAPVVGDDNALSFEDLMKLGDEEPATILDEEETVEPAPAVEEPAPAFVTLAKPVEDTPVEEFPAFEAPVVEAPVAEPLFEDVAPIVAPVVAAPVDEVVDLLAEEEEAPQPASRPVLSKHQSRGFQTLEETPIEELMEKDKQTLMENSEALHTVDAKDPAAKREFDSIMDFFNEL
ncbi:MAG: hypothetical protein IJ419_04585 [Agathobacter sp.]|nr:hypothetical protein [Agathobacter sp.]